jgi:hypothetical protein
MKPAAIENWHRLVETKNVALLDEILADDAVFLSPVVHTPQKGKPIVKAYLSSAMRVLNGDKFRYLGEWCGENSAVLEFATEVQGIEINGVDIIGWNAAGKIDHFKVMVRPLKAINLLHQLMAAQLAKPAASA